MISIAGSWRHAFDQYRGWLEFRDTAVITTATVVRKNKWNDALVVEFMAQDDEIRVAAEVSSEVYKANLGGKTMSIGYLPNNPKTVLLDGEDHFSQLKSLEFQHV